MWLHHAINDDADRRVRHIVWLRVMTRAKALRVDFIQRIKSNSLGCGDKMRGKPVQPRALAVNIIALSIHGGHPRG